MVLIVITCLRHISWQNDCLPCSSPVAIHRGWGLLFPMTNRRNSGLNISLNEILNKAPSSLPQSQLVEPHRRTFNTNTPSIWEIASDTKRIKSNKAPGADNIASEMLQVDIGRAHIWRRSVMNEGRCGWHQPGRKQTYRAEQNKMTCIRVCTIYLKGIFDDDFFI